MGTLTLTLARRPRSGCQGGHPQGLPSGGEAAKCPPTPTLSCRPSPHSPPPHLRDPRLFTDSGESRSLEFSSGHNARASPSERIKDILFWFPKRRLLLFRQGPARMVGTLSPQPLPSISFSVFQREQLGASNKGSSL